jgi:hypothetical protein
LTKWIATKLWYVFIDSDCFSIGYMLEGRTTILWMNVESHKPSKETRGKYLES